MGRGGGGGVMLPIVIRSQDIMIYQYFKILPSTNGK